MSRPDARIETSKWLEEFHKASATLDADYWLDNYFTEDASLQYANDPVIQGNDVRQMFKDVFAKLDIMKHEILYFDVIGSRIYQSARIRYLIKGDDPTKDIITIPGFAVFCTRAADNGEIRCYKAETFLDPSPVFRRIVERLGAVAATEVQSSNTTNSTA